ncbi:hypothetical protein CRG98_028894 [Punica granatum]|uniref:Uncharacterized protein n=1 Tax=Punica granatum TaxID=22663 RepID=A0A2I0J3H3_PUNGR|nr:hypothetical protein CRG98_028894 [Punica granatum]
MDEKVGEGGEDSVSSVFGTEHTGLGISVATLLIPLRLADLGGVSIAVWKVLADGATPFTPKIYQWKVGDPGYGSRMFTYEKKKKKRESIISGSVLSPMLEEDHSYRRWRMPCRCAAFDCALICGVLLSPVRKYYSYSVFFVANSDRLLLYVGHVLRKVFCPLWYHWSSGGTLPEIALSVGHSL